MPYQGPCDKEVRSLPPLLRLRTPLRSLARIHPESLQNVPVFRPGILQVVVGDTVMYNMRRHERHDLAHLTSDQDYRVEIHLGLGRSEL